jgi:hypothetical protein
LVAPLIWNLVAAVGSLQSVASLVAYKCMRYRIIVSVVTRMS